MIQYNDYEEYGNSFRTPKAMRPEGSPANNAAGMEQVQPEGRPPKQAPTGAPADAQGGTSPGQPPAAVQPPPTFRELQQQGRPRPPAPMGGLPQFGGGPARTGEPTGAPLGFNGGTGDVPSPGGGLEGKLRGEWENQGSPQQFGGRAQRAGGMPGAYQGQNFNGSAGDYQAPGAYQGKRFGGRYNAYDTPDANLTGRFNGQGGAGRRVDSATGGAVLQGLQNPSRWDNDLIKSQYDLLAGGIDDQYNKADLDLQGSLARRGLGAIGDTTVGSNDARYQNLQRRSAKSDALATIMSQAANTQAADRSQAISAGLGYGGQQFEQGLQGYDANARTNQQNFGQNLARAQFGAGERQGAYDRSFARDQYNTGLGQQGYENQMRSTEFNARQGQQGYENARSNAGFNNQVGQQGYENQMGRYQYEQGLNQQDYENEAQNFGMNQGARQQADNQRQRALDNYLGYGQQGFNNQRATAQDRQAQQQQEFEQMLKLLGY